MIAIGIIHIVMLLTAYLIYAFITFKSFSGKIDYRVLAVANALYFVGFILGMIWAKIEWGYFISLDIKMILSIVLFFPFFIENIAKTRKFYLPLAGMVIMAANYIVPMLMNSVHTH
jgi:ABC-type transport system involved in cytochrome c biogenesis permease subunit